MSLHGRRKAQGTFFRMLAFQSTSLSTSAFLSTIMLPNKNPRAQIDSTAPHNLPGDPAEQDRGLGAFKRLDTDTIASLTGGAAASRRKGALFATSRPRLPQPSRCNRFPVKAYGGIKLISPWSAYERICDLRLGADHHVTIAQQTTSPHQQVAVRCFPGHIDNNEFQMLQQIRHPSFIAVFDAFRLVEITYVVFEHMHVSLHEMERSPKRVKTLHLPALLGPVCP